MTDNQTAQTSMTIPLSAVTAKPAVFETKTVHTMRSYEFERLVEEFLGLLDYSVCASEEWSHDSQHTANLDPNSPHTYTDRDRQEVSDILAGIDPPDWQWSNLLCELAARGIVPWGNWIIEVW